MTLPTWVRKLLTSNAPAPATRGPSRSRWRPTLETLEDRLVLSTITVMNTNDSGTGSLRQAILDANAAAGADVITFDPTDFGTPQTIRLLSSLPDITDDLTINGPTAARLTISGDANNDGVNDPGDVRLLSVSAGNVTLSYLTLANGRAQGADAPFTGDRILTPGSPGQGGALYVGGGTVALNNSALTSNTARGGNGAYGDDSQSSDGGVGQGGAIYVAAGGDVIVNNCTLSGNSAQGGKGGGKGGDFGTTIPGSGGNAEGGGIYIAAGGTATLSSSTLSGNTAQGGAGGDHSPPPLGVGGFPGRAFGGGLNNQGAAGMANTIVAGNQLGGLFIPTASDVQGTIASGGYNLIGITGLTGAPGNPGSSGWVSADLTGTRAAPLDPLLAALGDYGGPTQTMALLPGSPALDAGDPGFSTPGATDQRGLPRVADGRLDIGAFESRGFTLTAVPGSTPQRVAVGTPFANALAVTLTSNEPDVPVPDGTAISYSVSPAAGGAAAALSADTAATSGGQASVMATANAFPGSYTVTAAIAGASPVTFNLDNDHAVPTVTVNPVNLVYGTALADGQLSGTATAVVNGQTVSVPGTFVWGTSGHLTAGTVLGAGDGQSQAVTFVPDDPASYASVSTNVVVNVAKATLTLTWANPADIVYGTALGGTQLDATASAVVNGSTVSVPGTFTYTLADGSTPAAGAVLAAGQNQTLLVSFSPTDTTDFTSASGSTTINVLRATPTITWANPADITYGTPLSAAQLDATAAVAGTFTYSPAAGTVLGTGARTLSVTFTPADTTDYTTATASALLAVDQATLTVTADDATRSYGVANPGFTATITGFVHGDTLATSDVTGSPSLTTAATAASPPGSYAISAGLGSLAAADYAFTFVNGTLTVTAAPLAASGVNFLAAAGGPYSGPVATFSNPDPLAGPASYSATITWGDGSSSIGAISDNGDGSFSVNGTHTYTNPGSYSVGVQISHNQGFTTPATTGSTATVVGLGQPVQRGMVADPAFWAGASGQALILNFDGGPASTTLAGWLAATLPNLFGAAAGAFDLTGMSNAQVALFYQWLRHQRGRKLEAQVLALALSIYATTPTLGGGIGGLWGLDTSGLGLGPLWVSVGRGGSAFGVANHSRLSVWQVLQAIDGRARLGTAYPGSSVLRHRAERVLDALPR
jgi:hypothetical protein